MDRLMKIKNKEMYKKNSKTPCVYKLIIGEKFYIGGTTRGLGRRKHQHSADLRDGAHKNYNIQELYDQGKEIEIEILEFCEKDQVLEIEQKYLDMAKDNPNCLNICFFAGSVKGITRGEEHKRAIGEGSRKSWKERPQVFNQERRTKMSNTMKEGYASGRIMPSCKGRGPAGEKCALSKLKEADVLDIYDLRKQGWTHKRIAAMYDVTREAVTQILNGKCWVILYDKYFSKELNVR